MVIKQEQFVKQVVARIMATKKISGNEANLESNVKVIYNAICKFNSLSEFEYSICGVPLSEIKICDEWKDFIIPSAVRLDPTDLRTQNMLDLTELSKPTGKFDIVKLAEFRNAQSIIRGYFKTDDKDKTTDLATLRRPLTLFEVSSTMSVKKQVYDEASEKMIEAQCVRSIDEPFIPVPLQECVSKLYRSDFFNTTLDQQLTDYFSRQFKVG